MAAAQASNIIVILKMLDLDSEKGANDFINSVIN